MLRILIEIKAYKWIYINLNFHYKIINLNPLLILYKVKMLKNIRREKQKLTGQIGRTALSTVKTYFLLSWHLWSLGLPLKLLITIIIDILMNVRVMLWAYFFIHGSLILHGYLCLLLVIIGDDLGVIVSLMSFLKGTLFFKHLLLILVHVWSWVILSMHLFTLLRHPLIHLGLHLFILQCLLI